MGQLKVWARLGQRRKCRAKLALASYVYPVLQFSSLSFLLLWGDFWGARGSRWNLYLCWCLDFPLDSVQSIHEMEFSTEQAQGFPQVTAQVLQGQLAHATTPSTASTPVSPPALTGPEESPQNFSRIRPPHRGAAFLNSSWAFRSTFSLGALLGPIDFNATIICLKLSMCLICA